MKVTSSRGLAVARALPKTAHVQANELKPAPSGREPLRNRLRCYAVAVILWTIALCASAQISPPVNFDLGAYIGSTGNIHIVGFETDGTSMYIFGSVDPATTTLGVFASTATIAPDSTYYPSPFPGGPGAYTCFLAKVTPGAAGAMTRDYLVLLPNSDSCNAMTLANGEVYTARRVTATPSTLPITVIESFSLSQPSRTRFNLLDFIRDAYLLRERPSGGNNRLWVLGTCSTEQEAGKYWSSLDFSFTGYDPKPLRPDGTLNCLDATTPRQYLLADVSTQTNGPYLGVGYVTFFGYSDSTIPTALETNGDMVYVSGQTSEDLNPATNHSRPFITPNNAYQAQPGGGWDGFLMAFNSPYPGAQTLVYSSYLGGDGDDIDIAMGWNPFGHLVLVGNAESGSHFPGLTTFNDQMFLAELDISQPPGTQLVMSRDVTSGLTHAGAVSLVPYGDSSSRMRVLSDGTLALLASVNANFTGSVSGYNPLLLVYDPVSASFESLSTFTSQTQDGARPYIALGSELYLAMENTEPNRATDGSSPDAFDILLLGLPNYQPADPGRYTAGSVGVPVRAIDQNGSYQPVTVTFLDGVDSGGHVFADPIDPASLPPGAGNFQILGAAYDITLSSNLEAAFNDPLNPHSARVCFGGASYPDGSLVMHFNGTSWEQVGKVTGGLACGLVHSLSPFLITAPGAAGSDVTPPVLNLPGNLTVEATGPAGSTVTFSASASDNVDGAVPVTCIPPSGSPFSLGTTAVNCSATDAAGNTASGSFTITVRDTTPPSFTPPGTLTAEATGPAGATVNYSATANDLVSGVISPVCSPASGSTFALGTTTVNCTATDTAGNSASGSLTVTVRDTMPPSISCGTADGLWHNANVIIACTASDGGSGLANAADASFSLSSSVAAGTEPANASTGSRTVCDKANNCATAGPVSGNKIDLKGPAISITSPMAATYTVGEVVNASYTCTDGGSGMASCVGTVPSGSAIDTTTTGTKTFTVNSRDAVGNTSMSTVTYMVQSATSYGMCLSEPNHQILFPIVNGSSVFLQGYPVLARFRFCDSSGKSISTAGLVTRFRLIGIKSGTTLTPVDQAVASAISASTFQWDPLLRDWFFLINTKPLSKGNSYLYRITLKDGSTIDFSYSLK
jgi:hypothetical protein